MNHIPQAANAPMGGPGRDQLGQGPLRPGRDSAWGEGRAAPGAQLPLVEATVGLSEPDPFLSCMPANGQCPGTSPNPHCPLAWSGGESVWER